MTTNATPPEDRDAAWLEALAGRPVPLMDEGDRVEAERLRRVLAQRVSPVVPKVTEPSEADFQRFWEQLAKEQPQSSEVVPLPELTLPALTDRPARQPAANRPLFLWGMAASVMLATVLVVQLGVFDSEHSRPDEILRGESATPLIVEDPGARATELEQAFQGVGTAPTVKKLKDGRIILRVEATPAVLDLLAKMRILPQVKEGHVVLVLERPATSSSPSR
jgi:hypothetical protein